MYLTINVTFKIEKQVNTSLLLVYCCQIRSMFTFLASTHADQGQVSSVEVGGISGLLVISNSVGQSGV
jgi:hypothetical protein